MAALTVNTRRKIYKRVANGNDNKMERSNVRGAPVVLAVPAYDNQRRYIKTGLAAKTIERGIFCAQRRRESNYFQLPLAGRRLALATARGDTA